MFQRITTYFLCLSMIGMNIMPCSVYATEHPASAAFNEAEILEKYPNARVIHVTKEEYRALEKELQQRGYLQSQAIQLAQNDSEAEVLFESEQDRSTDADDCAGSSGKSSGNDSFQVVLDITDDVLNSGGSSSGDESAVVFVIIGTVVVLVWTLYVFKYLYDISLGHAPCGRWHEVTVVRSSASTGEGQHARFDGLRYSTGFRDGTLDVGIGFELGQADILLSEVGTLELQGRYWMLGPILRWRITEDINPSYFQMNFIAGSTEHDEVGLLAKASLGLLFGIGDAMQLGFNWGAMNIDLNENQGIITERDQYHYFYGLNVGFKF